MQLQKLNVKIKEFILVERDDTYDKYIEMWKIVYSRDNRDNQNNQKIEEIHILEADDNANKKNLDNFCVERYIYRFDNVSSGKITFRYIEDTDKPSIYNEMIIALEGSNFSGVIIKHNQSYNNSSSISKEYFSLY